MNPLDEGQQKALHPFFQKPLKTGQIDSNKIDHKAEIEKTTKKGQKKVDRRKKPAVGSDTKQIEDSQHATVVQAETLDVDPNNGRRKRQKTASPEAGLATQDSQTPTTPTKAAKPQRASKRQQVILAQSDTSKSPISKINSTTRDNTELVLVKNRAGLPDAPRATSPSPILGNPNVQLESTDPSTLTKATKPKKVLQFNPKTGTIGSPPKKPVPLKKQGKGKKSAVSDSAPKSKIVVITYGRGSVPTSEFGAAIDKVLNCPQKLTPPTCIVREKDPETAKEPKPTKDKDVIPWWKIPKKKSVPTQDEIQNALMSQPLGVETQKTRSSPRKPPSPAKILSTFGRPRSQESKPSVPLFKGFGDVAKSRKFPGAIEPAWPWKGVVHIHGDRDHNIESTACEGMLHRSSAKKSKYHAVEILKGEDIIDSLATNLRIDDVMRSIQAFNIEDFAPLPSCLRLPSRYIETGSDLQRRVRKELVARMGNLATTEDSSDDEINRTDPNHLTSHPALVKVYNSIATSLSPYDKSRCESLPWTQRYAPKSTDNVLQKGPEASILKDWLQKLTVLSVESGSTENKSTTKRSATKAENSGKRKRKSKKLDGFVISSDEEDDDMDEITDLEGGVLLEDSSGPVKKTVIRSGDVSKGPKDSKRLTNAVVISGPHGCGKSATVFAVAKELGFEVFEINSSSRRSGKDVMERVGDMTRNHLVQRSRNDETSLVADDDEQRLSNAVADDLETGRQGTMNSFFNVKGTSKSSAKPKNITSSAPKAKAVREDVLPKGPLKQQKQSLILLEEVDVLYEEDRGFWQTVMLLIAQSKRPIIMTCNDESAVPLMALSLHAIIRFAAVPTDLAVDYMLLVAANEGHALRREAVKALYESRQLDLRGSLTELEFWCQFAIGDRKAGLEWFYPRLPTGCDLDKFGNKHRVVSEGTYRTGMGWLCQDSLESQGPYIDIEEETLHEAWDGWCLDASDWQRTLDVEGWANNIEERISDGRSTQAVLSMYDDFAEAMSATDCYSHYSFGIDKQELIDASHPELSSKAKEDYLLANVLLDVSPQANYEETSTNISLWIKSRARELLQIRQHIEHGWDIPRELDGPTEQKILMLIRSQSSPDESIITRRDFSAAFDPIAEAEKTYVYGSLEPSCFDRTMNLIALDVAPFVRSIVAYDARLQKDRVRLSNLLSQGGGGLSTISKNKRMRTTRAAMSALEGGVRSTTRREKYFGSALNPYLVLRTGSQSWLDAATSLVKLVDFATGDGSRRSSVRTLDDNTDENGLDELTG